METISLAHVVYTNIGRRGYGVVESPDGWPRPDVDRVASWLRSLQLSGSSSGYASGAFHLQGALRIAIAVVHASFGSDKQARRGGLAHAFLRSVTDDSSDREIAPQSGLMDAALAFGREVASQRENDPARQLETYRRLCRRHATVEPPSAPSEVLRHVARDTLPWLVEAVTSSRPEKVLPLHSRSGLKPPQRLARAAGLLPPRLALSASWGCWMRPNESLRCVVNAFEAKPPEPRLPDVLETYLDWLVDTDRAGLEKMLGNWEIRSFDDLAKELRVVRREARPKPVSPVESVPSPGVQAMPSERAETVVEEPRGTSNDALPPEFLRRQLEAMRRELDESVRRRFELLEKSLGVARGGSQPASHSAVGPAFWNRIERPLLYGVLLLLGGVLIWQQRPEPQAAPGATPPAAVTAAPDLPASVDAAADPAEGGNGSAAATPTTIVAPGSEAPGTSRSSSPIVFQGDWRSTWESFASQNRAELARWIDQLSRRHGLEESQLSNGQASRFAGYVETLRRRQLTASELTLARQGLFEYVVALWIEEEDMDVDIRIDLVRREIQPAVLRDLLSALAPEPGPEPRGVDEPELQAAVVCTWIARR